MPTHACHLDRRRAAHSGQFEEERDSRMRGHAIKPVGLRIVTMHNACPRQAMDTVAERFPQLMVTVTRRGHGTRAKSIRTWRNLVSVNVDSVFRGHSPRPAFQQRPDYKDDSRSDEEEDDQKLRSRLRETQTNQRYNRRNCHQHRWKQSQIIQYISQSPPFCGGVTAALELFVERIVE